MEIGSILSSLVQSTALKPTTEFYPGQIIRGQIIRRLSEQQALVQIGNIKVVAQMENDLVAGDETWLQVQGASQPAVLKILKPKDPAQSGKINQDPLTDLIISLGMEDNKANRKIISRLMQESLPVHAPDVTQIKELTQTNGISLNTIIFAIKKGIPFSAEALIALDEFFARLQNPRSDIGWFDQLRADLTALSEGMEASSDLSELVNDIIELITKMEIMEMPTGNQIDNHLRQLNQLNPLLSLLQQKLAEPNEEHSLGKIIHFISGQQLALTPSPHPIQQWIVDLPLNGNHKGFVQMESKKQSGGQIDPDNCRMLFFLDMEALGNIVVDLLITKKIVSIQLFGDHPELESLTQKNRAALNDGLKVLGFMLSGLKAGISVKSRAVKSPQELGNPYKGVDFRI